MKYTLGIDIGTFESKGVLADQTGKVVAQSSTPHKMLVPQPGWAEHRPDEDWWGDFVTITRDLLAQSGVAASDIAAVAASAIGPCMLPVDAEGRPLMNGVLYGVDTRAHAEIDLLNAEIGEGTILDRCGNALTSQSVGPKILWLKRQRPELYAKTARVLTASSYLTFRLTGEYVIDHYTAANFSPLYDVTTQDWCDDLAPDIIGLEKLPKLMWSSEIAGEISDAAAAETGLAAGTPVLCGTIDAGAEALSVGLRAPGDMMMMYGSTIFVIQRTSERVTDPALWYAPWMFPGEHVSMAGLATSGTLTHWFRDQFASDLDTDTAFATLTEEAAASPPGAKGLLVLPYFSGERTPIHDPHAKGVIFGLDLTHTRADIYRAVIEGIAHGTAHVIDTFRDAGQAPLRVLAVGGGTKNGIWLQATSDIGGVPQVISRSSVGASLGDAFLAAVAVGLATRDDIQTWNPPEQVVEPVSHPAYDKAGPLFRALYTQTRDIAHALGAP
ncbi:FGGY-family carbohydrate kinase [Flavimaricola marinus]|uniref:Xylulose kinase n=1 Tax=Flavimaricola marinus TaxID=1819565 RepID=A0A238LKH9_9RHOB|nr:FGGY-family carbohydrate kinase [Flavimaricola marinus]SMY09904.1 Xylulose kinase [Flavimaricola marinus]